MKKSIEKTSKTCGECAATYDVEKTTHPWRDKDSSSCDVCGAELLSWDGGVSYTHRLVKAECAGCKKMSPKIPSEKWGAPHRSIADRLADFGWGLDRERPCCGTCASPAGGHVPDS